MATDSVTVRPGQLSELLSRLIPAREPVLITGAPGSGKTEIVHQAALFTQAEMILSHPAVSDPTDAKGLPWLDKGGDSATFLPFGDLARALKANRPTVWFLDDLGQAPPAVQASFMQLILARRVNDHILPDCVTFVAATNRRSDRAGVSGILEPVKSRFATIVELSVNLADWCNWAFTAKVPAEVIAFLRFREELLHKFEPTSDLTNSPSPRTWAAVGRLLNLRIPEELEFAAIAGAVGQGAAVEFVAFLKMFRQLPSIDSILFNPHQAVIPEEPSALFAVSTALASRANDNNFDRVYEYCKRLEEIGKAEFAILTLLDSHRRTPSVANTTSFIQFASSDLGKLAYGE
ncbi:MAG TPA: AAA family ATPase [Candidatus Manganitrophaceae bacterium]|nr:AAA family ATPase [Candidatus Manganitrophaceae bacterium]